LKVAFFHESDSRFRDSFIIQGVTNVVPKGGFSRIRREFHVDDHVLFFFPLPIKNTDDAGNFQAG